MATIVATFGAPGVETVRGHDLDLFCASATPEKATSARLNLMLGDCFLQGSGRAANVAEAVRWYVNAGNAGEADGWASAGAALIFNSSNATDRDLAISYLVMARNGGATYVNRYIAMLHLVGRGLDDDPEKAIALLGERAVTGDEGALALLAYLYERGGYGIVRDELSAQMYRQILQGINPKIENDEVVARLFDTIQHDLETIGSIKDSHSQ